MHQYIRFDIFFALKIKIKNKQFFKLINIQNILEKTIFNNLETVLLEHF